MERRTWNGLEWVVAPVVALVAGVVNGELAPASEIEKSVPAWNGRPVPLGHPMDDDGEYVSANTLNVLADQVPGWFFNAAWDGERLTGEIWLSVAMAQRIGGDALAALTALEAGQPIGVSTAYWCDVDERAGSFNGKAYKAVQRNLRPDHLALLLHEQGACSWADGCGAPRVNQEQEAMPANDGVMVAFYPAAADADALAATVGDMPAGSQVTPPAEIHLTLAYLGTVDEAAANEAKLLTYVADFARSAPVMRGEVNGLARFANDEGEGLQALVALFDGPYLPEWRQELLYWVEMEARAKRNHGFTPHLTLAYVPAGEPTALAAPPRRPLVFDRVSVVWGARRTDFALQGMVVEEGLAMLARLEGNRRVRTGNECTCEEEKAMSGQEQDVKAPAEEPVEQTETGSPLGAVVNQTVALPGPEGSPVAAVAQLIADLGGVAAVRESLELMKANRDEARQALIGELTANQWCAFSRAELEAMPNAQLAKLAQSLRVPSFEGRGGVRANQGDAEWEEYAPPAQVKAA